ncbi:carbohydrate ABC transporter permease [Hungatella hathewayi]|uniref:carbohydrate ABC transporter permease n=1 Tax=Hungatella hathewayi TaxID=154046 RepID=UPI0035666BBD
MNNQNRKTMTKDRAVRLAVSTVCYVFVGFVALLCILPFIHILSKSVSEEAFVVANKVFLTPKGFKLDAYNRIFHDPSLLRSMYVTIVVTIAFTAIGMFLTICAAYALTRKEMKGRKLITILIMFTYYFSAGAIPEYLLMNRLHMLDTWWCLILPLCFAPYNLLIMRNNFQSAIPESLFESARLDGASHFTILRYIVIPLSKPILATVALFYAVGRWNAYGDALYYIKQRTDLRPLQLKLYHLIVTASESFQTEGVAVQTLTNPEVLRAACIMFAALPIICVYPFIQKYFVQGTMVGAVKE